MTSRLHEDVDIDAKEEDMAVESTNSAPPAESVPVKDPLTDGESRSDTDQGAKENGHQTLESEEHTESDEHEEHATIAEVTESINPADTKEENIDEVIGKIKSMLECESVEVLESGEILVLPKGWSTRASRTHGGKTYYVNPYGHTQWLRPPMKTNIGYKWVHEIEVTFGTGRLGLNLKQISGEPGQVFSDILVHIEEIYKLSNGMASPAEIYNWSVKPEKRLRVGMRMTAINGMPLTGCTYSDVLDRITRLPRPIRIKFADITRGIVGRAKEELPQEETEEEREARLNQTKQKDLRIEYLQMLVSHELHLQVWQVSKGRIQKKEQELKKKEDILSAQLVAVTEYQANLEKEQAVLIQETENLNELIQQLKLQEAGSVPSPEVAKTPALQERNTGLDNEVKDLMKENEELREERVQLDAALDALQKELDLYGGDLDDASKPDEIDVFSAAFLGTHVDRGSLDRDADDAKEQLLSKIRDRRRQLELELYEEEEQVRANESERFQLKRQMSSVVALEKREDDLISGDKPPQLIALETRVDSLRKSLHDTVQAITVAAKEGDRGRVDNLSIRRRSLKEELAKALDDVQKFEIEFNIRSSVTDRRATVDGPNMADVTDIASVSSSDDSIAIDTNPVSHQEKLSSLRSELHEVVVQMSKTKDPTLSRHLSGRRLNLKNEIKALQDDYQQLTRESLALPPMPPRPPSIDRISIDPPPAPEQRDRSNSRSSSISTASQASVALSVDSIINQPTTTTASVDRHSTSSTTATMPMLAGALMKHPSHSNEKGMFGNMSLRGVRERYCVLDGSGALLYYKRKSDREARGSIPLDHPSLEVVYAKTESKSSEFSICTPTHQNKFVAKTRDEMMKWVKAIVATHMVLMQRRSGASLAGRVSNKESTLRHQVSVVSNEDGAPGGRASDGGLAPAALAVAAAADATNDRASSSSSHRQSTTHRATLGF